MEIVICKLITGEFIVGKLKETHISDCFAIIMLQDPSHQNQYRSVIVPLMAPFDDKPIKQINLNNVLSTIPAHEDIQRAYVKLTSGIDIISSGSKIIQ